MIDSGQMVGLRESLNMICLRESNLSYRNRDFVRDHLQKLYHNLRDIACQSLNNHIITINNDLQSQRKNWIYA